MFRVKAVLLLVLLLVIDQSNACEKFRIPMEVVNESKEQPTKNKSVSFLITTPYEYKGWRASGISYKYGSNIIPLYIAVDQEIKPTKAISFIQLNKDFYENGKVSISYTPIPKTDSEGEITSVSPCLHTQEMSLVQPKKQ